MRIKKLPLSIGIAIVLPFIMISTYAYAEIRGDSVYLEVKFPKPQITPSTYSPEYSHIEMRGMPSLGQVGEPVLPVKGLKVLIPDQCIIKDVEITPGERILIPGKYLIEPGQQEYPLSMIDTMNIKPDKPKPEVYESLAVYPGQKHILHSTQNKMGYSVGIIELHPVEYNPLKREIYYYTKMSVTVRFEKDYRSKSTQELRASPRLRTKSRVRERDRAAISRLIDNKEDLSVYDQKASMPGPHEAIQPIGAINTEEDHEYVIITHPDFVAEFARLLPHRKGTSTQEDPDGTTAIIVTTDWIYANYPGTRPDGGEDNQTKIRNFIKDAYNNWGTKYVLLAGDGDGAYVGGESGNNIIPARGLADSGDNDIASDLYYSCLHGSFDSNHNGIYGERDDGADKEYIDLNVGNPNEVDLLAEVLVGRAPVDSVQEAKNFVDKTLAYEYSADDYLNNSCMVGERMGWGGISEYATASMEEIRLGTNKGGFTTQGFQSNVDRAMNADTLYDSYTYTWSKQELIDIINNGVHILNHMGHSVNTNNMKLLNSDADALTNDKYYIAYSQGCYAGAFDNRGPNASGNPQYIADDCIVEHLITGHAGAVAYIANSRYGLGTTNSTTGSSQFFNRQFWDALFGEGRNGLGIINQDSKEVCIPYLTYNMNRFGYFTITLFGDPALEVHIPDITVFRVTGYDLIEKTGDRDRFFEPGEISELTVSLKALNHDALNAAVTLSADNPYVVIEQNNSNYGAFLKGEVKDNINSAFRFTISPDCPKPYGIINFILTVAADGHSSTKSLAVTKRDYTKRITGDSVYHYAPIVSGDKIVYYDYRNGNADIFLYDLADNTETQITNSKQDHNDHCDPRISGNRIVWCDSRNNFQHIFLYDLDTSTETQITNDENNHYNPVISGDKIAWVDYSGNHPHSYLYDLAVRTGAEPIDIEGSVQDISGDKVVYYDDPDINGYCNISVYDLTTNTRTPVTTDKISRYAPRISGNKIVYYDSRTGSMDAFLYDLASMKETQLTTGRSRCNLPMPAISGDKVVWCDERNENPDIYLYDLADSTQTQITTDPNAQEWPSISGNYIIWCDGRNGGRDIYMYKMPPKLVGAVSRKTHLGAGDFDIELPFSGGYAVETRLGGPTKINLTFSEDIQILGDSGVHLSTGTLKNVNIVDNEMTIDLEGAVNEPFLHIALRGIADKSGDRVMDDKDICIGILPGDVNNDHKVDPFDVLRVRGALGQITNGTNYRSDVNCSGKIDNFDLMFVRGRLGKYLVYNISGNVRKKGSDEPVSDVTISISGQEPVITAANGHYAKDILSNGEYIITPSKAGYIFDPASRSVTIDDRDVVADSFTAIPVYSVSGYVKTVLGDPVYNVSISIQDSSKPSAAYTAATDINGHYTISGIPDGEYTATPSRPSYVFDPASQNIIVDGCDLVVGTFKTTNYYSISGNVVTASSYLPVGGVTISISDQGIPPSVLYTVITNEEIGYYEKTGLPAGQYTLTPQKSGYSFSPVSQEINGTSGDLYVDTFLAIPDGPQQKSRSFYEK